MHRNQENPVMVKKIKDIPESLSREIKGFEELFSEYMDSEENKEKIRKERENQKGSEQYELQHFLEQENHRLTGIEILFTKKLPSKLNFSQTEKLTVMQMQTKRDVLEKIILEISKNDSHFNKNLQSMFNAHFS